MGAQSHSMSAVSQWLNLTNFISINNESSYDWEGVISDLGSALRQFTVSNIYYQCSPSLDFHTLYLYCFSIA